MSIATSVRIVRAVAVGSSTSTRRNGIRRKWWVIISAFVCQVVSFRIFQLYGQLTPPSAGPLQMIFACYHCPSGYRDRILVFPKGRIAEHYGMFECRIESCLKGRSPQTLGGKANDVRGHVKKEPVEGVVNVWLGLCCSKRTTRTRVKVQILV